VPDGIDLHKKQREQDMGAGLANMEEAGQVYWRAKGTMRAMMKL